MSNEMYLYIFVGIIVFYLIGVVIGNTLYEFMHNRLYSSRKWFTCDDYELVERCVFIPIIPYFLMFHVIFLRIGLYKYISKIYNALKEDLNKKSRA